MKKVNSLVLPFNGKKSALFLLFFALSFFTSSLIAQVSGDYRSNVTTGNWNVVGSWQTYNGSSWVAAATAPTSSNSVYIQSAHTITLTQNESCIDLHIATGTTAASSTLLGRIALSTFTLSVNGKLRCYFAAVGTIPGTSSTAGYSIYPFTGTGKVSIVGTTRNITATGEWSGTVTTASTGVLPLEINMNSTSDTARAGTSIKASSFVIARGILNASTNRMAPDNAVAGQGDFTINSGGTFRSAQIGTASGSQAISRTGTTRCGNFVLNTGGRLILSGAIPTIDANSFTLNGVVEYAGSNVITAQSFLRKTGLDASAVDITTYSDVVLNTTATSLPKTLTVNTTINGKLTLQDSARFALSTFALTYGASASLEYLSTSIGQTAFNAEWPASGSQPSIVSINNSANVTLGASTNIPANGRLALVSGKLILGANNLTMSSTTAAFSTSASSASPLSYGTLYSSYIVTNSTGGLIISSVGTSGRTGDVLFPVGPSTTVYNPSALNVSTAASNFTVRAVASSIPGLPSAQIVANYWNVSGTGTATIQAQWNVADEGGSFVRANARMVSFGSSITAVASISSATGSNPYSYTSPSYSSFNNFGIMSGIAAEPTSQTSSLSFANLTSTSFDINFNAGNGTNRLVLVKANTAVDANPVDGTSYTASTTFGSGSEIGTGNYVAFNGTSNTVSVSGLTNGVIYTVAVYEFNGLGGIENYLTTSPAAGNPFSPAVSLSTNSLSAFSNTALGSSSTEKTFTVSGVYLDADIALNAPSGFEISTTSGSGFGSSLSLVKNGSNAVNTTTVYVRFTPNTTGAASGNIAMSSLNVISQNVSLSGFGIAAEPTVQASNVSFSNIGTTNMTINWSSGNGANRVVIVKANSAVTSVPSDITSYTANTIFGSGTAIAAGEFVVYGCCGGGNSVAITGLSPNATYFVAVYEFNGSGGVENYLTTSVATGSQLTNSTLYRTVATGNWNATSTWETSTDGTTWTGASVTPNSTDGPITILANHTVTVSASVAVDQLTINATGGLNVSSGFTLTVNDGSGTDVSNSGTIANTGTITISSGASLAHLNGSKYQHTQNAGTIPASTWNTGSTCEVTGVTSATSFSGGLSGQAFHHFIWNNAAQASNLNLSGNLTTVNGNLTILNSNAKEVRLSSTTVTTLNIGGNLVIGGGAAAATLVPNSSSATATINIGGDLILNASGSLNENSTTGGGKFAMSISGNIDASGGGTFLTSSTSTNTLTLVGSASATKTINMGSGSHTFGKCDVAIGNGTTACTYQLVGNNFIFNTVNSSSRTFTISSLATLDLNGFNLSLDNNATIAGTGTLIANGTGSTVTYAGSGAQTIKAMNYFNLVSSSTGARTLPSLSTVGIANIFTSGSNSYTTALSTVLFNGTSSQTIPAFAFDNVTINNAAGVVTSGTTTMDSLVLTSGTLNINSDSLTLTANVTRTSGNINAISGTVRLTAAGGNVTLPASMFTGSINKLAIAAVSNFVQLGDATTVSTDLNLVSGTLRVASNTLTLNGSFTSTSGVLRGSTTSDVTIGGSGGFGSLMMDQSSTSALNTNNIRNFIINRSGTTINMGNSLKVNSTGTLTLTAGTLNVGSNTFAMNGAISLGAGVIDATSGTVSFLATAAQTVPANTFSSNSISNLNVGNAAGVTINNSITVTGILNFPSAGIVITGASNKVILSSTGSVTGGGTGWVIGNLQKNVAVGSGVTRTYEIGDATNYLPVAFTFASVTTAGDLSININSPMISVPNYGTSPINNTHYVERYWSLTNANTLAFTNYDVIFNYAATDLVGSATAASLVASKYSNGWSVLATSAGTLANTLSGVTTLGDFVLSNPCVAVIPSVTISTSSATVCNGSFVSFTATATNGGSSPVFVWQKNGTGNLGSASTIQMPPGSLATGDIISAVMTANNNCQTTPTANSNTIQLTVNPSPAITPIYNAKTGALAANSLICTLGDTLRLVDYTQNGVWSSNRAAAPVTMLSNTFNRGAFVRSLDTTSSAIITYGFTSTNGCVTTATINLIIMPKATPATITGSSSAVCVGSTLQLSSATSGAVWSILSGRATVTNAGLVTGTSGGLTTVRYTDSNSVGCKSFASYPLTVNAIPAVPSLAYAANVTRNPQGLGGFCIGRRFAIFGTPAFGTWGALNNRLTITDSLTGTNRFGIISTDSLGASGLNYTVTDGSGCSNRRTFNINIVTCAARGIDLSNEQLAMSKEFTMYPNPARSFVSIQIEKLVGSGSIVVTDLYGKTIKTQPLSMGTNTVDIAKLAKGMYFVSVITNDGKTTKKLVVE